jgi:uncharacterized protein
MMTDAVGLDPRLLEVVACPNCHAKLTLRGDLTESDITELACSNPSCGLVYPIRDGIPVLLVDEATTDDRTDAAEVG